MNRKRAVFTGIELIVGMVVLGILAVVVTPSGPVVTVKGARTKALAQAHQIGLALLFFAEDNNGVFPKIGTPEGR